MALYPGRPIDVVRYDLVEVTESEDITTVIHSICRKQKDCITKRCSLSCIKRADGTGLLF